MNQAHNDYQRRYYEHALGKPAMQLADTPYVWRHVAEMIRTAGLETGKPVLEIGTGLGKFSVPLIRQGFALTCLDLSPIMLDHLSASVRALGLSVTTIAGDAAHVDRYTEQRFERAIGFFVLHHVEDLDCLFGGLKACLVPGATITFCEPAGWSPLYFLQIVFTPGMRWAAEKGVLNMTPGTVLGAMRRAGFEDCRSRSYGFLPPFLYNRTFGRSLELALERVPFKKGLHAFQLFHGKLPS
jgi:SAM-dependent methyltransferase